MNLEALSGAILNEHDYGVIAGQEDLVVRGCDLLRKIVSESDLRPATYQFDLARFLQPAIETGDEVWLIHNIAVATASTLTGCKLGKRARIDSIAHSVQYARKHLVRRDRQTVDLVAIVPDNVPNDDIVWLSLPKNIIGIRDLARAVTIVHRVTAKHLPLVHGIAAYVGAADTLPVRS
jgi:hypothetical protein